MNAHEQSTEEAKAVRRAILTLDASSIATTLIVALVVGFVSWQSFTILAITREVDQSLVRQEGIALRLDEHSRLLIALRNATAGYGERLARIEGATESIDARMEQNRQYYKESISAILDSMQRREEREARE